MNNSHSLIIFIVLAATLCSGEYIYKYKNSKTLIWTSESSPPSNSYKKTSSLVPITTASESLLSRKRRSQRKVAQ